MAFAPDFSPLEEAVDPTTIRVFTADARSKGIRPTSTSWLRQTFAALAVGVIVGWAAFALIQSIFTHHDSVGSTIVGVIFGVVFVAIFALDVLYVVATVSMYRARWKLFYRMTEFAERNGLSYTARVEGAPSIGALFRLGITQYRANVFAGVQPTTFELGSFRYTYAPDGASVTRLKEVSQAYLALTIPDGPFGEPWPHTILRAKKSTGALDGYLPDVPAVDLSNRFLAARWELFSDAPVDRIEQLLVPELIRLLTGRTEPGPRRESTADRHDAEADYDLELIGNQALVYGPASYQWVCHATVTRMLGILRFVAQH